MAPSGRGKKELAMKMKMESTKTTSESTSLHLFAVVIVNPTSGSYSHRTHRLDETLAFLRRQGWEVEVCLTKAAGDAGLLARQAVAQKADLVVAIGGDGTINEIIQELAGTETALGVLPYGTVNVWAREMGIPLDDAGARHVLVHGRTRRIDLGCADGRYFLLMAGVGIDGEVIHTVQKTGIKKYLGVLGYLLVSAWMAFSYPGFQVYLYMNGRMVRTRALQIIVGNTQLYGGAVKFTWQAKCDDGLLDVCVVRKRGFLVRVVMAWDFLFHRDQRRLWVRYESCTSVKIRTHQPIAIQLDGDPAGYTPNSHTSATFTIAPGALRVLVPEQAPKELFSQE